MKANPLIINEGGRGIIACIYNNVHDLQVSGAWFNPHGTLIRTNPPYYLVLNNVLRSFAGKYVCLLTSGLTSQMASNSVQVTVSCKSLLHEGTFVQYQPPESCTNTLH